MGFRDLQVGCAPRCPTPPGSSWLGLFPPVPPRSPPQLFLGWVGRAGVENTVVVGARMCRVELENLLACETGEEGLGERRGKKK